MHGSGGEKWKRSRHMWPVPNSTATTVAVNNSNTLDSFDKVYIHHIYVFLLGSGYGVCRVSVVNSFALSDSLVGFEFCL